MTDQPENKPAVKKPATKKSANDPTIALEQFLKDQAVVQSEGIKNRRFAGLDFGTKTIGVALSDTMQTIATGLETIKRTKFKNDAARLLEIAEQHEVSAFIIGLPLNMDGTEGPRVQSTKAFARNLANLTNLPLIFWDERMSTRAVERALLEADSSRQRRKEVIDKMAAAYILQGALDRIADIKHKEI